MDDLANEDKKKKEVNFAKNLSSYGVETLIYQMWANDLFIVFEDKYLLKLHSGLDSLSCSYILPEEKNEELLPINLNAPSDVYLNLRNNISQYMYLGAFENINDPKYVSAGLKIKAKWNLSQTKMTIDECNIAINNNILKKTMSNKRFYANFTARLPYLSSLFEQAQYQYNKYMTENIDDFALSTYPLIESRFIYERVRGFYQGAKKEIEDNLKINNEFDKRK